MPIPRRSACSPIAMPIPTRMPTADATRPVTKASVTTEVMICRRLAPSARNRPSSRTRCVTMMLKVLKMMKAPTKSDTRANTSRNVCRNPSPSPTWSDASFAASAPVMASYPCGSTRETARRSSVSDTPSSATTERKSKVPERSMSSCAVCTSKAAAVAPRRLSVSPMRKMPEIVNSREPLVKMIEIRWPTVRSCAVAVPASTATSVDVVGSFPSTRLRPASVDQEVPIVGAPPGVMASPVTGSTIFAYPWMLPTTSFTPGTASTVATTDSGTGSRSWPPPPPGPPACAANAETPCTCTSMPAVVVVNRSSNAALNVSVST